MVLPAHLHIRCTGAPPADKVARYGRTVGSLAIRRTVLPSTHCSFVAVATRSPWYCTGQGLLLSSSHTTEHREVEDSVQMSAARKAGMKRLDQKAERIGVEASKCETRDEQTEAAGAGRETGPSDGLLDGGAPKTATHMAGSHRRVRRRRI